jgi:4-hydroxy-2-oxoglutarate aldolase
MIAPNTAVTARFGVPGLKAALDMLGFYGGNPRSPMLPLPEGQKETLRSILVEAGILQP